jgi:hypothetical protein
VSSVASQETNTSDVLVVQNKYVQNLLSLIQLS